MGITLIFFLIKKLKDTFDFKGNVENITIRGWNLLGKP